MMNVIEVWCDECDRIMEIYNRAISFGNRVEAANVLRAFDFHCDTVSHGSRR